MLVMEVGFRKTHSEEPHKRWVPKSLRDAASASRLSAWRLRSWVVAWEPRRARATSCQASRPYAPPEPAFNHAADTRSLRQRPAGTCVFAQTVRRCGGDRSPGRRRDAAQLRPGRTAGAGLPGHRRVAGGRSPALRSGQPGARRSQAAVRPGGARHGRAIGRAAVTRRQLPDPQHEPAPRGAATGRSRGHAPRRQYRALPPLGPRVLEAYKLIQSLAR